MTEGEYSLVRVTSSGITYTTANVYVQVIEIAIESTMSLLPFIIFVLVLAIVVIAVVIIVSICVVICVKKRKWKCSDISQGKQQQKHSTSKPPGSKLHSDDVMFLISIREIKNTVNYHQINMQRKLMTVK